MRSVYTKIRLLKKKYFVIAILIVTFYIFSKICFPSRSVLSSVILPNVVVHLDLKGPAPKLKYLESLLPLLKSHGVNGLLMEYEDMFPYEGQLANLTARNCYSKHELRKFLSAAHRYGFEIIPLIQTFGHLEFALKLPQFAYLREVSQYPDSICPSKEDSLILINNMIEQVMDFHKNIVPLNYIHIGCDEVFHINKCRHCAKRQLTNINLFLDHINTVSKIVNYLSQDTIILIWDDMLRGVSFKEWQNIDFQAFNNIELVYWDYEPLLKVSHVNLMKYHQKFSNTWIASAFKGADGRTAILPNIQNRLANHFSWFNLILGYKFGGENEVHNFKGIILTGWSRYSHMDPPCELLPPSIPSLIINLLLIKKIKGSLINSNALINIDVFFSNYLSTEIKKSLTCDKVTTLDNMDFSSCNFNEIELFSALQRYVVINKNIVKELNYNDSTDSIEYYSIAKYINMKNIADNISWCNISLNVVVNIEKKLHIAMDKYYDKASSKEYVGYLTYGLKKRLHKLMITLINYKKASIWNRRRILSIYQKLYINHNLR